MPLATIAVLQREVRELKTRLYRSAKEGRAQQQAMVALVESLVVTLGLSEDQRAALLDSSSWLRYGVTEEEAEKAGLN